MVRQAQGEHHATGYQNMSQAQWSLELTSRRPRSSSLPTTTLSFSAPWRSRKNRYEKPASAALLMLRLSSDSVRSGAPSLPA